MLEAEVDDGTQNLGLEQAVPEPGGVDGDEGRLDVLLLGGVVDGLLGSRAARLRPYPPRSRATPRAPRFRRPPIFFFFFFANLCSTNEITTT